MKWRLAIRNIIIAFWLLTGFGLPLIYFAVASAWVTVLIWLIITWLFMGILHDSGVFSQKVEQPGQGKPKPDVIYTP